MNYKDTIRYGVSSAMIFAAICFGGLAVTVSAQAESAAAKKVSPEKSVGRDPFKKYEAVYKPGKATSKLEPPSIQARIERYRAQKMAAAAAQVAPPKPTTALMLNELQVIGIFRTPRGWAAMVEATPIKLSYVIYPGENFFDGQLVAIEESRLIFRRDIVWADGRREKTVEIKPLRQPSPVDTMTSTTAAPASVPIPESAKPDSPEKQ